MMVATTLDQGGSQSAQVSWDVLTALAERIGHRRAGEPGREALRFAFYERVAGQAPQPAVPG
jgi:hypothetical protein